MHMADALLSPAIGGTFWAGTVAVIAYASRKLKDAIDDRIVPLMGVLGAFIFASQMINFTIPGTGSSGHLGGGLILAVLLGPAAAFLVLASVLTVQALFFADGGLLALGCNIWNLGVYPCFIAYPFIYRPLAGDGRGARSVLPAALVSAVIGLQMGAFTVVVQTFLSGKSELPFGTFLFLVLAIHLVIGLVEGFVTAGVVNYVRSVRPELLESTARSLPLDRSLPVKKLLLAFGLCAIVLGGALSWFSSSRPDGLEWSIEKATGRQGSQEDRNGSRGALSGVQERTAILPDYAFREEKKREEPGAWPAVETGTSAAGLLGALIVLVLSLLIGFGIKAMRRGPGGSHGV